MAAIPGWVYVILGAVMILASQLIKDSGGYRPLRVFLWIGLIFIIIGFGKYIFKAVFKKPAESEHAMHAQHEQLPHHKVHHTQHTITYPQTHPQTQHGLTHLQGEHEIHGVKHHAPQPHPTIIACPVCKTRHYSYADYCMKCGTRMKKH